jgi:hypothetical protein
VSRWTPCKRRDFIRKLRRLGFQGPSSGARHQYMIFRGHRMAIPSNSEYSVGQLCMLLREVEESIARPMSAEEWSNT